jgi:mannose-6-phosphate isomerase-like protein (cupin superfamily)
MEFAMSQYAKPTLFRMSELPSACPPKHRITSAFTLIPKETGAQRYTLFCAEVRPGGEAEMDNHGGREHCYFILSGYADVTCAGENFKMHPGDCLWIPPHADHGLTPIGGQTVRFAVVTSPPAWSPEIK